jgi:hypothetical protein
LRRPENAVNNVVDKYGTQISFYEDVPRILEMLRAKGRGEGADSEDRIIIAACSRTHAPELYVFRDAQVVFVFVWLKIRCCRAHQCLQLLHLESGSTVEPALSFFDELEIYPCAAFSPSDSIFDLEVYIYSIEIETFSSSSSKDWNTIY